MEEFENENIEDDIISDVKIDPNMDYDTINMGNDLIIEGS